MLAENLKSTMEPPISLSPAGDELKIQEEFEKQKLGHRRVGRQGEVSYKRVPTNALMGAIQLGIANSIGSLASKPKRDLLLQDFDIIETVSFPPNGSQITPSHGYGDFKFQTYAPIAFRTFRDLFSIKAADFLRSICTEPLKELVNAGASGSIFYVSSDDLFIVKTVQHKEAEFLQKLLPGYYMNFNQNPRTLLPKFFGLFCYQSLGKNIRLLVMNNLLPQSIVMHEKYDVKGSTYKRLASKHERAKSSPTLKDLDFVSEHPNGLILDLLAYEALMKTISRDCLVLESFKIMDYSLLIGVHNITISDSNQAVEDSFTKTEKLEPSTSGNEKVKKLIRLRKKYFETDLDSRYPGVFPARNHRGDNLLLFVGIIDILQNYRLLKKLEHTWKSVLHDGDSISVHNPTFYAQRFVTFLKAQLFRMPSGSALRHSPSKKRISRKSISEKDDKDASLITTIHHTRPDIVPPSVTWSQNRRTYSRSDTIVEKPREKKIERLFAPDPEIELLNPDDSTLQDETITRL